ncbi:hypothetical protein TanjilG_22067 [Lupinus angustifolius]|uniref:Uncharacterized protein n=1 Tax=Lupinus angustifolius TaxID=3871 RepID=A0A4P1QTV3_LUPAN|nr:hypothetical protein TanjilG_22067 [Lupinus angustifolius]
MERCFRFFPCLVDPGRRSSLWLKLAFVTIHVVYIAILFLFDGDLVEKTKKEPWYTALYLLLCVVTLIQYFATSIASPGYALNAMRAVNERNAVYRKTSETSNKVNQLQAEMGASLLQWMEIRSEEMFQEVMQQIGQSWWQTCIRYHQSEHGHAPTAMWSSLREQSIVMIVTSVFFSLIITVFGLATALARAIIVGFGGISVKRQHCASGLVARCDRDTTLDLSGNFPYLSTSPNAIS